MLLDRTIEGQAIDELVVEAQQRVTAGKVTPYTWKDGLMLFQDRVYVPSGSKLREDILDEAHLFTYAIHPGETKMYKILHPHYWWPGMKKQVIQHVASCLVCQNEKFDHRAS